MPPGRWPSSRCAAARAARRTVGVALKIREQNRQPHITPPPSPFSAPETSINGPLTPERSFAASTLSLAAVKRVKNAFGCTVNDVVLTMCAGALRRYFDQRDEHPDGPLVAMVPVSVRTEDQQGTHGNQVSMMLTSLATDLDDPVERLEVIHASTVMAKEQQNAIGADTLQEWAEFAAPAIFGRAARLYSNTRSADRHRPDLQRHHLERARARRSRCTWPGPECSTPTRWGPIFDGGGLNITLMSYLDRIDFGLIACPDLIPDVWSIADGLRLALAELEAAADERAAEADARAAEQAAATRTKKSSAKKIVAEVVSRRSRPPPADPAGQPSPRLPEPGAQSGGHRLGLALGVAGAGPEEAAQTVLAVAGHHVGVQVGLALADPVVHGHERSRRAQHRLHGHRQPLHRGEVRGQQVRPAGRPARRRGARGTTSVWPANRGRMSRKASAVGLVEHHVGGHLSGHDPQNRQSGWVSGPRGHRSHVDRCWPWSAPSTSRGRPLGFHGSR